MSEGNATLRDLLQVQGIKTVDGKQGNKPGKPGRQLSPMVKSFSPPPIRKVQSSLMSVEDRQKAVEAMQSWTAEIGVTMHEHVTAIRAIEALPESDRAVCQEELTERRNIVREALNYPEPWRTKATTAYSDAVVKASWPEGVNVGSYQVNQIVGDLVGVDFLTSKVGDEQKKFVVEAYGNRVTLAENFRDDESREVFSALETLVGKVKAAAKQLFEDSLAELKADLAKADNKVNMEELLAGKPGTALLPVNRGEHPTNGKKYPGGYVLITSDGASIRALKGAGGIFFKVKELAAAGTCITVRTITKDKLELPERLEGQAYFNALSLYHIMRRAMEAAADNAAKSAKRSEATERTNKEKAEMAEKFTLMTATEFYEGEAAGFFLEDSWKGVFKARPSKDHPQGRAFHFPFCVVQRDEHGRLKVADGGSPARFAELFKNNFEFREPGDNFVTAGVLGILLRNGQKAYDRHVPGVTEPSDMGGEEESAA